MRNAADSFMQTIHRVLDALTFIACGALIVLTIAVLRSAAKSLTILFT